MYLDWDKRQPEDEFMNSTPRKYCERQITLIEEYLMKGINYWLNSIRM